MACAEFSRKIEFEGIAGRAQKSLRPLKREKGFRLKLMLALVAVARPHTIAEGVAGAPARIEGGAAERFQGIDKAIEIFRLADDLLAARQFAIEHGHRLGEIGLIVVEPDVGRAPRRRPGPA